MISIEAHRNIAGLTCGITKFFGHTLAMLSPGRAYAETGLESGKKRGVYHLT